MRALIGRDRDLRRLERVVERARDGAGSLVLIGGEAGIGKSRLAGEVAAASGLLVLRGAAAACGTPPYGPVVAALRAFLRARPDGLAEAGPLRPHLALLLPELGEPAEVSDRATLFEAIRCALTRVVAAGPAIVTLDDLHWSDQATLELLPALAGPIAEMPLVVLAAYRSDGLPRGHAVRRLRHDLRRAGHLDELTLEPLDAEDTRALLEKVLGGRASATLARAVHDRTEGVPFFVEELAGALRMSGALAGGADGFELAAGDEVPVPDTVRDAVLITTAELSGEARVAAETAAAAGPRFDLGLVAGLSSEDGMAELVEHGLVRELDEAGHGAFRHALTRDALYADVPWLRRRALHRELAAALEAAGAAGPEVAAHWAAAREPERARAARLRSVTEFEAVHAYRDAASAAAAALEQWPEREEEALREETLERHARCAELAGDLPDAVRSWRELSAGRAARGDRSGAAEADRRLAAVHDLRGDRDAASTARRAAADGLAAVGRPAEAAVERLLLANQLRLMARHRDAAALARVARDEADAAGRLDLRARALGLEGMARAKAGEHAEGVDMVRGALALALEHDLTPVAAELYQRLSVALYDASDYAPAEAALHTALELCRATGEAGTETACVSCLAYVLRERGEWERAAEICTGLIRTGTAVFVAEGLLGAIHAAQGRLSSARRLLTASLAVSTKVSHYNMRMDATAALARVAAAEGDALQARQRCHALLAGWQASDDHHYAIDSLRWSSWFLAATGDLGGARACIEALSRIAAEAGYADALGALGQAIAETALAEGDADTAAEQLTRAVEHLRGVDLPFQLAEVQLRAGVALRACGERDRAVESLGEAYRIARRLGARPLAAEAAREVAELGEPVARTLGRRAAAELDGAGLSRRELEVMRLVAAGRTNVEIAHELFLSRRTVDMHVRNILRKLDCRSRAEASTRAAGLGLLA